LIAESGCIIAELAVCCGSDRLTGEEAIDAAITIMSARSAVRDDFPGLSGAAFLACVNVG